MKAKVKEAGLEEEFVIDSAGTYGGHSGALPDSRMRQHAVKRGYVLDSRARHFYASADFPAFDMIIGMDDMNIADLRHLALDDKNIQDDGFLSQVYSYRGSRSLLRREWRF